VRGREKKAYTESTEKERKSIAAKVVSGRERELTNEPVIDEKLQTRETQNNLSEIIGTFDSIFEELEIFEEKQ